MTNTNISPVETVRLYQGDCREVMAEMPDNSVDAIVCDPPYEISFCNKKWDSSGIAFDPEVWAQALRVLKPGGHLLAFGGTRTWHRLAVAIEDAGFEIRDNLAWLYGNGMPKNLDVSKAIDKAAGAKRPVIGTRTTGIGTGRGGTAIMGDSDNRDITAPATADAKRWQGWGTAMKPAFEPIVFARKQLQGTVAANVTMYGTGALNIDATRIPPTSPETPGPRGDSSSGRWPSNAILDEHAAADLGDVSRFFYVAKAPTRERPSYTKADGTVIKHATVKPLSLMRQLVRLVVPPGGLVLDPFAGSGATIEAALLEGFNARGIEMEPDHIPLIEQRVARAYEARNTAA